MRFIKMEGLGNDYVYVDTMRQPVVDPAKLAIAVSRPHVGIGSDGLVLIGASDKADFSMRIYNADGSEAEMCGNATRCVGKYLYERSYTRGTEITLDTKGGVRTLWLTVQGDKVTEVRVDMGVPSFSPIDVGANLPGERMVSVPIEAAGKTWCMTCVSVGNPHAVIFVPDDPATLDIAAIGGEIERHPLFPQRINVEFAQVISRAEVRMRVWERGSGETQACGTGACAVLAAAVANGLSDARAVIHLKGGDLLIEQDPATGHLFKTGPANIVFEGEYYE